MHVYGVRRDISLWCDKRLPEQNDAGPSGRGKKRPSDSTDESVTTTKKAARSTNYSPREDEIEDLATELKKMHGDKFSCPQYKLWSRLIKCGQHDDKDNPLNVPTITGSLSARERKQKDANFSDALAGAAVAIVKALKGSPEKSEMVTPSPALGISPGKKVLLSGQYLKQLETIPKLKDEGVLSPTEYNKQKERIMTNLESLH